MSHLFDLADDAVDLAAKAGGTVYTNQSNSWLDIAMKREDNGFSIYRKFFLSGPAIIMVDSYFSASIDREGERVIVGKLDQWKAFYDHVTNRAAGAEILSRGIYDAYDTRRGA